MAIKIGTNTSYIGLVVSLGRVTYDCGYDEIRHAFVWNWETLQPDQVDYYNSHPGSDLKGDAEIDMSQNVKEAYELYLSEKQYQYEILKYQKETNIPGLGFTCIILRGRTARGSIVTIKKMYKNDTFNRCLVVDQNNTTYEVYIKNMDVLSVPLNFIKLIKPKPITNLAKLIA